MEQNQNPDPFEQLESKPITALNAYDQDKKELFGYLMAITDEGFEEYDDSICAAYLHNTARSFTKVASALRETTSDTDEAKRVLKEFWTSDDAERVTLFRKLTATETHQFIDNEEIDSIVDRVYQESDNFDELEENIMNRYKSYLRTDTNILLGKLHAIMGIEEEDAYDSDVELYERGPEVLKLVNKLEKIAFRESQGFKEGYEDGISLSRKVTDMNGEFVTEFLLYAERAHIINDAGQVETTTEYNIGSKIEYFYHGIESLPAYVRDFLCDLTQDEELGLSLEDITDEHNIFTLQFTYSVTADGSGTLWPYHDLLLKFEDTELPIPDPGGYSPEGMPDEEHTEPSTEEQELFNRIFSDTELSEINASMPDAPEISVHDDLIEAFRSNITSITFATTAQHIAMARSLADEFKQKKKH